jgi:hypothetical protein
MPLSSALADQIAHAFSAHCEHRKIVRANAGDVVFFMCAVIGLSGFVLPYEEVLLLLRERELVSSG